MCRHCGINLLSFRSTRKPSRRRSALWKAYLQNRTTVSQLAKDYGRSVHWIRNELSAYELPKPVIVPDDIVAIIDCVFFRRSSGYLVVRNAHNRSNVYWNAIESETITAQWFINIIQPTLYIIDSNTFRLICIFSFNCLESH